MESVAINSFVRRQTEDSEFSYFEGTDEELIALVTRDPWKPKFGYRDGVIHVSVPVAGFWSEVIPISLVGIENLVPVYEARADDEAPVLRNICIGAKRVPAMFVDVVLCTHTLLAERADTECKWEVTQINASPTRDPVPMHPTDMMRNQLGKAGGFKGSFSAQDFARSIEFWADHVQNKRP